MRPSTEIAAFDGGMRMHRRGSSSRRDPDARFIRCVSVCICALCTCVWSTHNSRLHRFINARNTTLALTHASLNRGGKSRWNAEARWKLGGEAGQGKRTWRGVESIREGFLRRIKVAIESSGGGNCAVAIKDDLSIGGNYVRWRSYRNRSARCRTREM